ncbi:two-component system sensor histidine kinase MprB [Kitasatospora sp. MAP12-15]|uniref:sensor histidine kinase n=1 Tax=unclassified Kitasatospora TaxID=2633591 RepID=UPI002473E39B|nr:HAMP domain-containing sensor histidine kinase [Kitasatospora sp. MAP12-44]MDH6112214.1 two-component system sensor histidine kinase MprB [Kitasatospora sp. MAP12-44]
MSTTAPRRRGRLSRWYHGRSLRSRLAILASLAVAVAIMLCSVAAWFIVHQKLYDLQRQILSNVQILLPRAGITTQAAGCGTTPQAAVSAVQAKNAAYEAAFPERPPINQGDRWDVELLNADGSQVCMLVGTNPRGITIGHDYLQALDLAPNQAVFHVGSYTNGDPAMIKLTHYQDRAHETDWVLVTASPLNDVDHSLQQLALLLLGVVAVGAIGAGITGRVVARTALKPVHELTEVVEHIARTEEVGTTIPVHGNDEIARLSSSFNSMSTALANSRDRQTRLIADAGHELRTPLTSLRTNVDLMIRSDDTGRPLPPATKTKLLGSMKAQMQELTLLIGDLLQLSRPDSPKPGQNVATVAFHEIVGRAVERAKLRGPGLTYRVELKPWYVRADAAALERAVMNLLDNAVKYSPPAAAIEVLLEHGRLTVRDHGPGIPTDELQYVFDRFWRSPSSRQLPGSGLGLSIVAQTVEDSGGQVALGPAQDGGPGTLATVRLPGSPQPPEPPKPGPTRLPELP